MRKIIPRAKIVATLGPASRDPKTILALAQAGVSVFRLNFSHGDHAQHAACYEAVRATEKKLNRFLAVMADLQGPKLRIGTFKEDKVTLKAGEIFTLHRDRVDGDHKQVTFPHPDIFPVFTDGDEILINDGRVRLRVEECSRSKIVTRIQVGGELSERKGVNIPNTVIPVSILGEKDMKDLQFSLSLGVDYIALSFVQQPSDIEQIKAIVQGRANILAKLEKPVAIKHHLKEIVKLSDGVMVARGDLGVETPSEMVPALQKRIITACRRQGRPVLVATQMLESMIHAPLPTRAETSDVATALYDGADGVMLSAETASGSYPVEAVATMRKIILATEADDQYWARQSALSLHDDATSNDIIARAAVEIANHSRAVAIVAFTSTGSTAIRASRVRSSMPILSLTPRVETARRLALAWGVESTYTSDATSVEEMEIKAKEEIVKAELGLAGHALVVTAGLPFGTPGMTNLIRLTKIKREKPKLA